MNREWTLLCRLVPQKAGDAIPWESVQDTVIAPFVSHMKHTPQNPKYHGEGDVWAHTVLVCEQLCRSERFWQLCAERRTVLFMAALLHDIGKIKTTRLLDGEYVSPHHSAVGMQIARKLLWVDCDLAGTKEAQQMRESICTLIRYHNRPVHAAEKEDPERELRRIASGGKLMPDFTLEMLCLLSEADVLGRIAEDRQSLWEDVRLCEEMAKEAGCFSAPYPFPDAHTTLAYLCGRKVAADVPLYDDTWGEVLLICGLPGTGKDHWIAAHCPELPMLSPDAIRREYGVKPTDDQGHIIQETQKRAKEMLAHHQPFVFNGTNVTDLMRGKWAQLFTQYHARVRILWLETRWEENLRRNQARKEVVPESVIDGLLGKMTLPEATEAQTVEWLTV